MHINILNLISRLQAAGSKEKLGAERRNPTILRKSNTFDVLVEL
jgi:hypothetical protein